jgi:hypothetical protein
MSFLQPLALLGLLGAAIPPLLHLMGRKVPPLVTFPAIRYLTETERKHSRRLKLRNLILLILRTVVIALIALAAARPVARVGFGGTHSPTAISLIVDNSLSSGAMSQGSRILDLLVDQGRHVLDRAGSEDRLWLVLADGLPRRISVTEARQVLDTLLPWPVRLDLSEAVRTSAGVMANDPLGEREIVLLSDLQRTALSPGFSPDVRVLVWAPPPVPENRGVDSVWTVPEIWSPRGDVVSVVGGAATSPSAVRLTMEGRDLARSVAAPGDRVVLSGAQPRPGWFVATVGLDPDELRGDDVRYLAVRVSEPAAATALPGAGPFVTEALQVLQEAGRARAGDDVLLNDRLVPGQGGAEATVLFPPADPAMVGAINRELEASGVGWRFGEVVDGEWELPASLGGEMGVPVVRRRRLEGSGVVLGVVGSEPWLVRDGQVIIVASRMELSWTSLPVAAAFIPFLDRLVNRVAADQSWIVRARPGEVVGVPPSAAGVLAPAGLGPLSVPTDGKITVPLARGVYFLRGAGADTVGALEVNHDSRESLLEPAGQRGVRAALAESAMLLTTRGLDRELFRGARRADLTGPLLVGAVLLALVELVLAAAGGRPGREP